MQNSVKREVTLGALFITAIIFLIFVSITISQTSIFSHPQLIKVQFDQISGLRKGDTVRVLGMEAGSVYRLSLRPDNTIRAVLKLNNPIQVREDYHVTVEESSILGGNFIGLNPGTPGKPLVNLEAPLKGELVSSGLGALGQFVRENQQSVKEFLEKGVKLVSEAAAGKGTLGKLIQSEDVYNNVKDATKNLKEISESLKKTVQEVENGEGNLGKFLKGDDLYKKLDESADSLRKTLKQIESTDGFLGKLIYDKKFADQVSQAGDSVTKLLEPAARTKVYAGAGAKYYPKSSLGIADFFIRIEPRPQKYFLLGGSVFSMDSNTKLPYKDQGQKVDYFKLDLQIAYGFGRDNNFTFRTGLLEGKFGGALDYEKAITHSLISKIGFTYEIRDCYKSLTGDRINENLPLAMNRAYAMVKFGNHIKVWAGASRLYSGSPEFMSGILFEYQDEDIKNFVGLITMAR